VQVRGFLVSSCSSSVFWVFLCVFCGLLHLFGFFLIYKEEDEPSRVFLKIKYYGA
jgi:hypothetical protein